MSRVDATLAAVLLIASTFFFTEWFHYRLGAPPIFELLLGPRDEVDGSPGNRAADFNSVTESEFQTYLRVLEAMIADRNLSIDDAVVGEHINLEKFRELEQRVQRNDGLVDRARLILREKAESLWNSRVAPLEHG